MYKYNDCDHIKGYALSQWCHLGRYSANVFWSVVFRRLDVGQ